MQTESPPSDVVLGELDQYALGLDPESREYWSFHRKRFKWTAERIQELRAECEYHGWRHGRMLDVGNSFQTLLFEKMFSDMQLDTLGFLVDRYAPQNASRHIEFDLNDAYYPSKWPAVEENERYDFIVMLEVLEHLYTSPVQVYRFLMTLLQPGGFLVIGTPNAAALRKRVSLCLGHNPYELIRTNRNNPGHFREYTVDELCGLGAESGLEVRDWTIQNFFQFGSSRDRFCDRLSDHLPQRFREAITIIYRTPPEDTKSD